VVAQPEISRELRVARSAAGVRDERAGFVQRPVASPTKLEAQIHVLVVGGGVSRREPAHLGERPRPRQQAGRRRVVDLAGKPVRRPIRLVAEAHELRIPVAEK